MLATSSHARANVVADRLNIGFIGTGRRGLQHVDSLTGLRSQGTNVELTAVCDIYSVQWVYSRGCTLDACMGGDNAVQQGISRI